MSIDDADHKEEDAPSTESGPVKSVIIIPLTSAHLFFVLERLTPFQY